MERKAIELDRVLAMLDAAFLHGEAACGLHRSAIQRSYAEHVAKGLVVGRQEEWGCLFAEAETGTGKTIGYLVPALIMQALTGDRVFLSTFTLALQRQIVSPGGDMDKAIDMVRSVVGPDWNPLVALRVGRRNFADIEKVRAAAAQKPDDRDAQAFLRWAEESPMGEWREYMEQRDLSGLPCGWNVDDICLSTKSDHKAPSYQRYLDHVGDSREADIVVTNHALTALNARFGKRLLQSHEDSRGLVALIVDECDRMPDAAASVMGGALSLRLLKRMVDTSRECLAPTWPQNDPLNTLDLLRYLSDDVGNLADFTQKLRGKMQADTVILDDLAEVHLRKFAPLLDKVNRSMDLAMTALDAATAPMAMDAMEDLAGSADMLTDFAAFYKGYAHSTEVVKTPILALSWSAIKHAPSLSILHLFPARIIESMWKRWAKKEDGLEDLDEGDIRANCLVLTSATLSTKTGDGKANMVDMAREYGVWSANNPCAALNEDAHFAPDDFGSMDIVFPAGDAPDVRIYHDATEDEDEVVNDNDLNPEWIQYVATAAMAAHQEGGHVLVLTNSYEGTKKIGAILSERMGKQKGLIIKTPEMHMSHVLNVLQTHPDCIFVTAGSWEGFDMGALKDKDGRRMHLSHVVFAQIPYSASDRSHEDALQRYMLRSGKTQKQADDMIFFRRRAAAMRKMRQGVGRGIRGHMDHVTLWFCDYRMPRCRKAHTLSPSAGKRRRVHEIFRFAIPERFRTSVMNNAWEEGRVLLVNGTVLGGDSDHRKVSVV